jgi:hypothetical protein
VTSVGTIHLQRRRLKCWSCADSDYAVERLLGGGAFLSKRLLRLACLLTSDHAFEATATCLQATCGVEVSGETLRVYCEGAGQRMAEWQADSRTVGEAFAQTVGELEFQMDAGKVNTLVGWRDYKLGVFAKRPLGLPATLAEWDRRKLPAPTARRMFAALETIEVFQKRLRPEASRLGITDPACISSLGDGAEWIWNAVDSCFPGGSQTLDVFHGREHVAQASQVLYGQGTPEAKESFERGGTALLAKGWQGVCDYVAEELARSDTPARREALESLTTYFAKHTRRLSYQERLKQGRSIGSGMVEGSIKTVGLRIKARGARWRVDNVDKIAGLCCLRHSSNWDAYWQGKL